MLKKKVLILASYPIKNPQHGGQKRAKAIYEFYKNIFSEVIFVGVYHRGFYTDHGENDILLGQENIIRQIDKNIYAAELISGKAIENDIHVRSHMAKLLMDFRPDIIQVEQIYCFLGLGPLLKDLNMRPKLILSSQTIEYQMKKAIYSDLGLPDGVKKPLVKQIEKLERSFSQQADLVIAVTKEEALVHKAMGAKKCVVAPNGIEKNMPTKQAINYWYMFKRDNRIKYIVTFIGSGHPPNWTGYLEMLGKDSNFMPPGAEILLGGGISEYFRTTYKIKTSKNKIHSNFWSKVMPLGHLSEDNLAGLLQASEIILLPITSGGGSNLKTAEAILSGKKIIATNYAFRGFEKYKSLPNIYIADTQDNFKESILQALDSRYKKRTHNEIEFADQVQWKYCLLPIKAELKKVSRISFRKRTKQALKFPLRKMKTILRTRTSLY